MTLSCMVPSVVKDSRGMCVVLGPFPTYIYRESNIRHDMCGRFSYIAR